MYTKLQRRVIWQGTSKGFSSKKIDPPQETYSESEYRIIYDNYSIWVEVSKDKDAMDQPIWREASCIPKEFLIFAFKLIENCKVTSNG